MLTIVHFSKDTLAYMYVCTSTPVSKRESCTETLFVTLLLIESMISRVGVWSAVLGKLGQIRASSSITGSIVLSLLKNSRLSKLGRKPCRNAVLRIVGSLVYTVDHTLCLLMNDWWKISDIWKMSDLNGKRKELYLFEQVFQTACRVGA